MANEQNNRIRLKKICEQVLEVKTIKIVIGRHKRPIDKEDEIIFHIDI